MSIETAIINAQQRIANAYTAVSNMGGTLPATQNLENLPTAISSISGGGSGVDIPREVSAQGVLRSPQSSFIFSLPNTVDDFGAYTLYYAFYQNSWITEFTAHSATKVSGASALNNSFGLCTNLTTVDLSALEVVGGSFALNSSFEGCSNLNNVDLSSLATVTGSNALSGTFRNCTSLTEAYLPSLVTISGSNALYRTYSSTDVNDVDFDSLVTISGNTGMASTFEGCPSLTSVTFTSLSSIPGGSVFSSTFKNCTSLSELNFPALTSSSFGSYTNQFSNMLAGVTGCTVHFPSNLQSVIGSWSDVLSGFGGTNTTVLFDLEATT